MDNVHFVNLEGLKSVFGHPFFYSFSTQLIDIELNPANSKLRIEREKDERTGNSH
jgi:hypothetical protein